MAGERLFFKNVKEQTAPLVLVIGAGLSKPCGLPDWRGLRKHIQDACDETVYSMNRIEAPFDSLLYESLSEETDYWKFFELAENFLGRPRFTEEVRDSLDQTHYKLPVSLNDLFRLKPKGIISLNLDTIAYLEFQKFQSSGVVNHIVGDQIARKWITIKEEAPWCINLHGSVQDAGSWVLNKRQLNNITRSGGHQHLLSDIYLNHTVLIVGASAEDIALSRKLVELQNSSFEIRRAFWLTSRLDQPTRDLAAALGLQTLLYQAHNNDDHIIAIREFVDRAIAYRSMDDEKPSLAIIDAPVISASDTGIETDPIAIASMQPEQARKALSKILENTLENQTGDDVYKAFYEFIDFYDFPIKTRAFYIHPSKSEFFDYKLIFPHLGTGNFGTVYHATDQNNHNYAIKIMHDRIITDKGMLGGFRRGARSMKIISDHGVAGVAKFVSSIEVPPTIIMELVPGNSLSELKDHFGKFPWDEKVRILCDIAQIVDNCHKLPEVVLHRDLKPSNIMLNELDYDTYRYNRLSVLDFDMSWHKGSSEKDVVFESRDDFGFLAPEQTDSTLISLSRSTKVDSYGLGMTAYALFSGRNPIANMPLSNSWESELRASIRQKYNAAWSCLPERLARAIIGATRSQQTERDEFNLLYSRLRRVQLALRKPDDMALHGLYAEEMLAQACDGQQYTWDDILDKGEASFRNGTKIGLSSDNNTSSIYFEIVYGSLGDKEFGSERGAIGSVKSGIEKACKEMGWKQLNLQTQAGYFYGKVQVPFRSSLREVISDAKIMSAEVDKFRYLKS